MKPASRTIGESGEGMVASTRSRRAVEVKGCVECATLHIGGGGIEDWAFSEGVGVSSNVGACGKPSTGEGRDRTQTSRGSRLNHMLTTKMVINQDIPLTCSISPLHRR